VKLPAHIFAPFRPPRRSGEQQAIVCSMLEGLGGIAFRRSPRGRADAIRKDRFDTSPNEYGVVREHIAPLHGAGTGAGETVPWASTVVFA